VRAEHASCFAMSILEAKSFSVSKCDSLISLMPSQGFSLVSSMKGKNMSNCESGCCRWTWLWCEGDSTPLMIFPCPGVIHNGKSHDRYNLQYKWDMTGYGHIYAQTQQLTQQFIDTLSHTGTVVILSILRTNSRYTKGALPGAAVILRYQAEVCYCTRLD